MKRNTTDIFAAAISALLIFAGLQSFPQNNIHGIILFLIGLIIIFNVSWQ